MTAARDASDPLSELDPTLARSPAWDALFQDTDTWVLVVRADGVVIDINDPLLAYFGRSRDDVVGHTVTSMLPAAMAAERMGYVSRALETGQVLRVDGMYAGMLRQSVVRPLPANTPGATHALVVNRLLAPNAQPGDIRAHHDDRGLLKSLTGRELEVLTRIGTGQTTAQIAKALHRSTKTIEWHRVALGNKLKAANRVELARIAIRLGLVSLDPTPEDADDPTPNPLDGSK